MTPPSRSPSEPGCPCCTPKPGFLDYLAYFVWMYGIAKVVPIHWPLYRWLLPRVGVVAYYDPNGCGCVPLSEDLFQRANELRVRAAANEARYRDAQERAERGDPA